MDKSELDRQVEKEVLMLFFDQLTNNALNMIVILPLLAVHSQVLHRFHDIKCGIC